MNTNPTSKHAPATADAALSALLARAEHCIADQREAYGTELDEDRAWRCAWNTWRTLGELVPAVRELLAEATQVAEVVPLRPVTHPGRVA